MYLRTKAVAILFAVVAAAFHVTKACNLKSLIMGTKMSAAASVPGVTKSIFDFQVDATSGKVDLSTYKGKYAYLVVNVASKCGLTNQNYEEMKQVYEKYSDDLEILAFPCNNFGSQEPGTNEEVLQFAKNKGATYPILGKLECENGEETAPFYKFLRASLPNGVFGQGLKWNFTKFLCDKNGVPVKRYAPTSSPLSIVADIEDLIKEGKK